MLGVAIGFPVFPEFQKDSLEGSGVWTPWGAVYKGGVYRASWCDERRE